MKDSQPEPQALTIQEDQSGLLSHILENENSAPDLQSYLRPGEKIVSVKQCPTPAFKELPNWRFELARMCGASRPEDIGKYGPAVAARARKKTPGQGKFECRFGRDGLIAANDVMEEFPLLARTTLIDYAGLIGMINDSRREEEFGRMFHEARNENDPIAKRLSERRGWGWPFYGAVDATPLFVTTLYKYVSTCQEGKDFLWQTYLGRDGRIHTMRDAMHYSMMWIISRINQNPQRFLEYRPAFEGSLVNQIMEDSGDSHFHGDGTLANFSRGNCSTEVQGMVYDALVMAAELLQDDAAMNKETSYWRAIAKEVRENVLKHFLIKDRKGVYLAVGSDRDSNGNIKVMKVRKAMPFFLLNSRLLEPANAQNRRIVKACARTIFSPELLCAGGLRTLATGEPRFMPTAYHNGASWPMQTFQIAQGLRKHGLDALALELYRRVVEVCEQTKLYPEHVRGDSGSKIRLNERMVVTYDSLDGRKNKREGPPQQIQLWTLTAYGAIQYHKRNQQNPINPNPFEEEILNSVQI